MRTLLALPSGRCRVNPETQHCVAAAIAICLVTVKCGSLRKINDVQIPSPTGGRAQNLAFKKPWRPKTNTFSSKSQVSVWRIVCRLARHFSHRHLLDQISKITIEKSFNTPRQIQSLPFFNLTLAYNKGAAFASLATEGGWQRYMLRQSAL